MNNQHRKILNKVRPIYDKPFINAGKFPATNMFIFMIYLKNILNDVIGADNDTFKSYAKVIAQIKSNDAIDIIDDLKVVVHGAAEFYNRKELDTIPLGIDNEAINAAIQDTDVNELCEYILGRFKSYKDNGFNDHEYFMDEMYFLFDNLSSMGGTIGRNKEFVSLHYSVTELVGKILNVRDDHVYADLVSGAGVSTFAVCSKANPSMYLADNASDQIILSEMLLAAFGKLKGEFVSGDSLFKSKIKEDFADRIFMDPPMRISAQDSKTVKECDGVVLKDSTASAIVRAYKALKKNGRAVVAVPGFALFGSQNSMDDIRSLLIDNHAVEAVITLPTCWSTFFIPTHLLVISTKDNESVRFIDILNDDKYTIKNGLTDEGIDFVYEMYKATDLSDYSKFAVDVSYQNINKETLVPAAYFEDENRSEYSRKEIDQKLSELYAGLRKVIDELSVAGE